MLNITVHIDYLAGSDNAAINHAIDGDRGANSPQVAINSAIDGDGIGSHKKVIVYHLSAGNGDTLPVPDIQLLQPAP